MFPVRCYTCNAVIAHLHGAFAEARREGDACRDVLDRLGVARMCCRRMFISHVESLAQNQLDYPNDNLVLDRGGTTLLRRCDHEHVVSCD